MLSTFLPLVPNSGRSTLTPHAHQHAVPSMLQAFKHSLPKYLRPSTQKEFNKCSFIKTSLWGFPKASDPSLLWGHPSPSQLQPSGERRPSSLNGTPRCRKSEEVGKAEKNCKVRGAVGERKRHRKPGGGGNPEKRTGRNEGVPLKENRVRRLAT